MARKKIILVETVERSSEVQKMMLESLDALGIVGVSIEEKPVVVCFFNRKTRYEAWRMTVKIKDSNYSIMYYLDSLMMTLELSDNHIPFKKIMSEAYIKNGYVVIRDGELALKCKRPKNNKFHYTDLAGTEAAHVY